MLGMVGMGSVEASVEELIAPRRCNLPSVQYTSNAFPPLFLTSILPFSFVSFSSFLSSTVFKKVKAKITEKRERKRATKEVNAAKRKATTNVVKNKKRKS